MAWPVDFDLTTIEYRLWPKIEKTSTCWWWIGLLSRLGYGRICVAGKSQFAHRVVYTLLKGPIPDRLTIDHLCRNKACVNPDHLEAVPMIVNVLRAQFDAIDFDRELCTHGHELSGDNLIMRGTKRVCRTCITALRKTEKYRAQTAAYDHKRYLAKKAQKLSA